MFPRFLLALLCLAFASVASSQANQYDEAFWQQLEQSSAQDPSKALEEAKRLIRQFEDSNQQESLGKALIVATRALYYLENREQMGLYSEKGLAVADALNDFKLKSIFTVGLGLSKVAEQDYVNARRLIEKGIIYAEQSNSQQVLGDGMMALGNIDYELGNYNEALSSFLRANDIFQSLNLTQAQSEALSGISLVYSSLGQNQKSVEYQIKSLEMIDPDKDVMDASIALYNIGVTYRQMDELVKARDYIEQALQKSRQIHDVVGIAYAEYELSAVAAAEGNPELALDMSNRFLPVFRENGLNNMVIISLLARGRHLAKLGRDINWQELEDARQMVEKLGSDQRTLDYHKTLAFIYEETEQYQQALQHHKKYAETQQVMFEKQNETKTKKMQAGFDFKQKEAENALLQKDLQLEKARGQEQKFQVIILILSLVLVLMALGAIFVMFRMQVKSKERFKNLAMYDDLTGAPNRRHIFEYAQRKLEDAHNFNEGGCLAILDIDLFKSINDTYGHDVGDTVLKNFFQVVDSCLRKPDRCGRMGGEEWLIVLPSATLDSLPKVFNRIQSKLDQTEFVGLPDKHSVTASMGAAEFTEKDRDIDTVIKRADELLYKAKQLGRNNLQT